MKQEHLPSTAEKALEYRRRGWFPIAVPSGSKNPGRISWQEERIGIEDIPERFSNGCDIGLILGSPSDGLVDVDLDCPEAVAAAEHLLPLTGMVQGRTGRPRSHYFFTCPDSIATTRFRGIGEDRAVLCELRSDGCQTIVAPSTHPSGESVVEECDGEPAQISVVELKRAVGMVASCALLARHWPKETTRHDFSMAVAGFLLRRGIPLDDCMDLIVTAAEIAGDEEVGDRRRTVSDTAARLEDGGRVTGFPTLTKILGEGTTHELLDRLTEWLGLKEEAGDDGDDPPTAEDRVEPFPLLVLPRSLRKYVEEAAVAFDCPADYFAVPMLAVAGAAVGGSRAIQVKPSWQEGARGYFGVVGPPGVTKSPALRAVVHPLLERQSASVRTWEDQDREHQKEVLFYEKELRDWKKSEEAGDPPLPPPRPVAERFVTSDATVEALAALLQETPHGIVLLRDELVGWVLALNQYRQGKGADRQFYLSAWSGETVTVDRRSKSAPLVVHSPFLTVLGGLTPDMLGELCDERGREDGFIHRLVFTYPDGVATGRWTDASISPVSEAAWQHVLNRLWELQPGEDENGNPIPGVLRLSPEAKRVWVELYEEISKELTGFDSRFELRGVWAKLRSYALRFALIIQLLRWASNEGSGEVIEEPAMVAAAALVKYFQSHARKVYSHLRSTVEDHKVELAAKWIRKQGGKARIRDLVRYKVAGIKKRSDADKLVDDLIDRGLAMKITKHGQKRGRPSEWVVLKVPKGRHSPKKTPEAEV